MFKTEAPTQMNIAANPIKIDDLTTEHLRRWVAQQLPREDEQADTLEMMLSFLETCSDDEFAHWLDAGWWKVYDAAARCLLKS